MTARDPRTTPVAGDVLRKGDAQVTIVRCNTKGTVAYRWNSESRKSFVTLADWLRWSATAEVLKRGEG